MAERQPSWDKYEAAILLEGILASMKGELTRSDAVKAVSHDLRAMSLDQEADRDGISKPTILSLDVLPEDVTDSNWLADTVDYTEEISTKLLEQRLRESLTPTQYGIYQACILNGISYKAYADQMGVSYQSVQNAIRLIQKKAKNIFG